MTYVNKGLSKNIRQTNENKKKLSINKRDTLPDRIDWRTKGIVRPIQDQGSCGSCWAFSTIDVLESHYALANNGTLIDLSEQNLVDCVYKRDGCDGGEYIKIIIKLYSLNIMFYYFIKVLWKLLGNIS
jgi:C1A family cysteine protease